jgi:hypothetical protein
MQNFFKFVAKVCVLLNSFLMITNPVYNQAPVSPEQQAFEKLNSLSVSDRITAVTFFAKKNDESAYELIKTRLLRETAITVQEKILEALEKRKSRKDFFTLLDFIRVNHHEATRLRAMKLMMDIHPPRLRYEIEQAVTKSADMRILLYGWLVSFQNPDETTKLWFQKVFRDTDTAEYFLTLRSEHDEKISVLLKPYTGQQYEFSRNNGLNLYWKMLTEDKSLAGKTVFFRSADVNNLPSSRRGKFLRLAALRGIKHDSAERISDAASEIKTWLSIKELTYRKNNGAADAEKMKQLLSGRISASQFYYLIKYNSVLTDAENSLVKNLCAKTESAADLCLKYLLSRNDGSSYLFWKKLSSEKKVSAVRVNFRAIIENKSFQTGYFINWLMLNPRRIIRLKAATMLPEKLIKQYETRICSLVAAEPEGIIRISYMNRFANTPELKNVCNRQLPLTAYFTIPEQLPVELPKSSEKTEKNTDDKPGDKPKP